MSDDRQKDLSMDQILQTIRGVVSGEDEIKEPDEKDDVLELTQVVEKDGAITDLNLAKAQTSATEGKDILRDIDQIISDSNAKQEQSKPESEPIVTEQIKKEEIQVKEEKPEIVEKKPTIQEAALEPQPVEEKIQARSNVSLISEKTAQDSSVVFKSFVKTLAKPQSDGLQFRSGTTVEELIVEAIRPQLSEWLDAHLPSIVKAIVEKEVQKLIPRDDD